MRESQDTIIPFLGFDQNETWTEQQLAKNDVIEWEAEHMRILYEVAKIMDEKWYKTNLQLATKHCAKLQGRSSYKRASQPVKTILEVACCAVTDRQCAITRTSWFLYVAIGGGILLLILIVVAVMLILNCLKGKAPASTSSGKKDSNGAVKSPAVPPKSPIASPAPPKKSEEKVSNGPAPAPALTLAPDKNKPTPIAPAHQTAIFPIAEPKKNDVPKPVSIKKIKKEKEGKGAAPQGDNYKTVMPGVDFNNLQKGQQDGKGPDRKDRDGEGPPPPQGDNYKTVMPGEVFHNPPQPAKETPKEAAPPKKAEILQSDRPAKEKPMKTDGLKSDRPAKEKPMKTEGLQSDRPAKEKPKTEGLQSDRPAKEKPMKTEGLKSDRPAKEKPMKTDGLQSDRPAKETPKKADELQTVRKDVHNFNNPPESKKEKKK